MRLGPGVQCRPGGLGLGGQLPGLRAGELLAGLEERNQVHGAQSIAFGRMLDLVAGQSGKPLRKPHALSSGQQIPAGELLFVATRSEHGPRFCAKLVGLSLGGPSLRRTEASVPEGNGQREAHPIKWKHRARLSTSSDLARGRD